jgi:hypothetical protein
MAERFEPGEASATGRHWYCDLTCDNQLIEAALRKYHSPLQQ